MPNSWKLTFQIAFTYIGTVVGAGFASGREISEFFVQYGFQGFIGIFLASVLFIWSGIQVMLVARHIKANSYHDISLYLFGKPVGTIFNIILLTILLGTTSVMLAATGSIFVESFQLSPQIGIWLSMLCIYVVTVRGLHAIHSVNSIFVPILIGFTILVFINHQPWATTTPSHVTIETGKSWVWITSPLYYVALNIALAQSVLVPMGREATNNRTIIWGGIIGGSGIGLLLMLAYLSMANHSPQILEVEMPMIFLLTDLGKGAAYLFAILVFAEIFSSLVANVFGIMEQMKRFFRVPSGIITISILLISYLISFIGFGSLLSVLYPLFGQVVVIFLFMLVYRQWERYAHKRK